MTEALDARLPGTADAEGWRRLHPLSPLLRGGLALIVVAGIVITNFRDRFVELVFAGQLWESGDLEGVIDEQDMFAFLAERGLLLVALGAVLGLVAVIIGFSWIAWRFSTYRITDEAVEARHGVVFRTHRRAPLERIQSVNLQRPLLARALGLTKIEVLTAGQGGKVELSYLGHRDAKTVREQIIRRAARKRDGSRTVDGEIAAPAPVGYDGSVYDAASGRLVERAQDFVDADVDPEAIQGNTLVRVPVGRLLAGIALSWEAVITVALVIGVAVWSAVAEPRILFGLIPLFIIMASILFTQFNKGFNFTLSRSRDSVRTGAGLTATATESIPFGRIHAVEARQPLLWRPLGWWKVRITIAGHSVAQGGQNGSQNVVLPVGPEEDVLRVIDTLLPGVGDDDREIASLRDGLSGAAEGYLAAGPRSAWVLLWGRRRAGLRIEGADGPAGSAPALGAPAPAAEEERATLRIRRGALTRSFVVMPIVRAQSVQFRRPLLHRLLGLASIQAHTVLGPVRVEMRGIELSRARLAFDELAAAVLRIQGAEAARRAAGSGATPAGGGATPTEGGAAATDGDGPAGP